jgi:hypothetical protein
MATDPIGWPKPKQWLNGKIGDGNL